MDDSTGHEVNTNITISATGGIQTSPDSLTAPGQWYWDEDEQAIYLYVDETIGTSGVEAGYRQWGFAGVLLNNNTPEDTSDDILTDHITIQDITFRGYQDIGIKFFRCDGIKIKNVTVYGIGATRDMCGILLTNVQNSIIEDSRVEYSLRNGISIYATQPNEFMPQISANNIISGNESS